MARSEIKDEDGGVHFTAQWEAIWWVSLADDGDRDMSHAGNQGCNLSRLFRSVKKTEREEKEANGCRIFTLFRRLHVVDKNLEERKNNREKNKKVRESNAIILVQYRQLLSFCLFFVFIVYHLKASNVFSSWGHARRIHRRLMLLLDLIKRR